MKGWVYIITNEAMPSLLKIGYSDRDPENRARELDSTASPHPHRVDFAVLVDSPKILESKLHELLSDYNEGKEWFRLTVYRAKIKIVEMEKSYIVTHGSLDVKVDSQYKKRCPGCKSSYLVRVGHPITCKYCNLQVS